MSSYFVKKTGSDANNGTTWALAKATVQAGFNLCTVAGDILYVAPGRYFEYNVDPPSAGTRASKKSFVGDWNSTVQDGGGNTSGILQGYVIIDASKQSGGTLGFRYVSAASPIKQGSNNLAYWNIKNLVCTGGQNGFLIWAASSGAAHDGVTYENILGDAWYDKGLQCGNWAVDSDTGATITFKNCIGISRLYYVGYGSGAYIDHPVATLRTNPNYTFTRCFLHGLNTGLSYVANSANKLRVTFNNCTIIASQTHAASLALYNAASDAGAANNVMTYNDCFISGHKISLAAGGGCGNHVFNRCKFYASDTEATQTSEIQPPLWTGIDYLYPGSTAIDTNSNNGVFPDLFSNVQRGNADFGAQEYVAGYYLREPYSALPPIVGRTHSQILF